MPVLRTGPEDPRRHDIAAGDLVIHPHASDGGTTVAIGSYLGGSSVHLRGEDHLRRITNHRLLRRGCWRRSTASTASTATLYAQAPRPPPMSRRPCTPPSIPTLRHTAQTRRPNPHSRPPARSPPTLPARKTTKLCPKGSSAGEASGKSTALGTTPPSPNTSRWSCGQSPLTRQTRATPPGLRGLRAPCRPAPTARHRQHPVRDHRNPPGRPPSRRSGPRPRYRDDHQPGDPPPRRHRLDHRHRRTSTDSTALARSRR